MDELLTDNAWFARLLAALIQPEGAADQAVPP